MYCYCYIIYHTAVSTARSFGGFRIAWPPSGRHLPLPHRQFLILLGVAFKGALKGALKGTLKGTLKGAIKGTRKGTRKGTLKGGRVLRVGNSRRQSVRVTTQVLLLHTAAPAKYGEDSTGLSEILAEALLRESGFFGRAVVFLRSTYLNTWNPLDRRQYDRALGPNRRLQVTDKLNCPKYTTLYHGSCRKWDDKPAKCGFYFKQ